MEVQGGEDVGLEVLVYREAGDALDESAGPVDADLEGGGLLVLLQERTMGGRRTP